METEESNQPVELQVVSSTTAVPGTSAPPSYHNSPAPDRGPPPTYEEAIDPDVPPPTYDSLFGRVREVRKASSGFIDFFKNVMILLIGTSGFGVLKLLLHLSARVRVREEEREQERMRQTPTQTVISCFMLGWFIIGSMWVYGSSHPSFNPLEKDYCNKFLYTFALGLVSSVYISLAAVIVCLCSASAVAFVYQANT